MTTSLAQVRTDLFDALDALGVAQAHRTRSTDYEFPAFIIGWPETMDVRPSMGEARDYVVAVFVEVEVTDDISSEEQLETMVEAVVGALPESRYDVRPEAEFGERLTADNRTIIGCRLLVAVYA